MDNAPLEDFEMLLYASNVQLLYTNSVVKICEPQLETIIPFPRLLLNSPQQTAMSFMESKIQNETHLNYCLELWKSMKLCLSLACQEKSLPLVINERKRSVSSLNMSSSSSASEKIHSALERSMASSIASDVPENINDKKCAQNDSESVVVTPDWDILFQ